MWYHKKIGGERCPIVDTWWQTETGGIMMSPLPGAIPPNRGSCTKPLPGIIPEIVDEAGSWWVPIMEVGSPSPTLGPACSVASGATMQRYQDVYWSKIPGKYLAGDNCALRRRWLLLDHGPHRRRVECIRSSAEHD